MTNRTFFILLSLGIILVFTRCEKKEVNTTRGEITFFEDVVMNGTDTVFAIFIPNGFSPNKDGRNDYFFPRFLGVSDQNYLFEIYTRSGQKLFSATDLNSRWDGETEAYSSDMQQMYVYKIRCRDLQGSDHFYEGMLMLFD